MEFDYGLQRSDHDQEVRVMRKGDLEVQLNKGGGDGEEDDVFYAEIRRQILLLTADDDEEEDFPESRNVVPNNWSASQGSVEGACYPNGHFNGWENEKTMADSKPVWLSSSWRNGKGTGVFIPQINNPRRNNRLSMDSLPFCSTKLFIYLFLFSN